MAKQQATNSSRIVLKNTSFQMAIGTIGPKARLENGEFTAPELQAFLTRLAEFYTTITEKDMSIPAQCVDGRSRVDGTYEPAPKAAGGTFTAVIGDALTSASYQRTGANAAAHARAIYAYFKRHDYVGGHDADHASEPGCGCGAEDKLEEILRFIRDNAEEIRTFLQDIGITVSGELSTSIADRSGALIGQGYVTTGRELREAFIDTVGSASIETLTGAHHEVAMVINTLPQSTVDRAALAAAFGDTFQLFELDVPALQIAANALSISTDDAQQKFIAMLYYNVATAAVLGDQSLAILVRLATTDTSVPPAWHSV